MGEILEALQRLQVVELQLAAIRRNRESKARRVETHKRQTAQIDARLKEAFRTLRERQIRVDGLSLEVAAREESIARHREALNKAKTNKEYSAILAAMNTETADNTKIENQILELMEEVQRLQNQQAAVETEKAQSLASLAVAEQALANYDAGCCEQRDHLMASRLEYSQAIAPGTLNAFLRVAEHHDGEAMAPVSKLHPKREDYICSGCNMTITLDVVNFLQTRVEIQLCRSCGRILYFEPSEVRP